MYVVKFEDLNKSDIGIAGGKGANLGELTQAGIPVPPGFVVTAQAYEKFMEDSGINGQVMSILEKIDINDTKALQAAAEEIKTIINETPIPEDMIVLILEAYNQLCQRVGEDDTDVAIRSSATAEDLPEASFAGQQDTFLHVSGNDEVIDYIRKCWASLFEARAIFYREENNFEHSKVFIAVVVQKMANADKAGVRYGEPGERVIPDYIESFIHSILDFGNTHSHTVELSADDQKKIEAIFHSKKSRYIIFGLTMQICEVITWMADYISKHNDKEINLFFCKELPKDAASYNGRELEPEKDEDGIWHCEECMVAIREWIPGRKMRLKDAQLNTRESKIKYPYFAKFDKL